MRANSFDHVALWVDERDALARYLCDVCGMHEIDRTASFTLVGGEAREGKLTLFDADGPRERGVLEQIVLRVPDIAGCVERSKAAGLPPRVNGGVAIDAPSGVPLGLVQPARCRLVDLDHVVLRVRDPRTTALSLSALGFDWRGDRLAVADRHLSLRAHEVEPVERPLLNHLALLVDSVDETVREAERQSVVVDRLVDAPNTRAAFVVGPDEIVVEYVEHKPGFALV